MPSTAPASVRAAVVRAFGEPPRCESVPLPEPHGAHQRVVDVLAAGLHPRVRSAADGGHYTSTGELPLVPGVDGVGRDADGSLLYFALPDTAFGSMAERTVIDRRRAFPLPADADPVAVAAGMNPAMSSWVALRHRAPAFAPGSAVLVLGATGNAGRAAVSVARLLGAGRVVGAGRDAARLAALPALGADATVPLVGAADEVAGRLAAQAADVDVVLDYLWGPPAAAAMEALVRARADRSAPLDWVQIGAVAGPELALPSALLRAANLRVSGSGQGSVGLDALLADLPELADRICAGDLPVDAEAVPLADVTRTWTQPPPEGRRVVLVP
ncbi:hypothetical protein [Actinomadura atramentaria]|uniref:hypothetical protein n=1 Tax=Actinomadura atramentaria TaxID=1990 RepID=UPI0003735295|nr:hypothetical protein [Actinomadura atramentaria]